MDESSSGTEPTRRKSARIYSRSHETELPGQSSHQEIFSLGDDLISGPAISKATLRSRRFYEKLKSDPEKYQAHKEKQAEKARMRRKALTQEEKTMQNAKTNARVKKCRAKKKELGIPLNKPLPLSSNTKAKIEERRIQERLRKRIYRASLNSWQKAWVNKKRRIQYEKKKRNHILRSSVSPQQINSPQRLDLRLVSRPQHIKTLLVSHPQHLSHLVVKTASKLLQQSIKQQGKPNMPFRLHQ